MEFSRVKLKKLRERKSLSQRELGELAGISHVSVWRIEAGERKPWPRTVRKLASALGVEPFMLLEEE
jgi:transcriptional regulator with XRE-family HTH domain